MRAVERRLRYHIKALEKEKADLEKDRQKFRNHFARRFRWWIELLGKQTAPSVSWLVEADAKELAAFEWWSW